MAVLTTHQRDTTRTPAALIGSWAALFALFAFVLITCGGALADPTFPALTGRVVDQANILSASDKASLEAELAESSWLMSDIDRDLIFNTPADRLWEAAIRRLGADPAALQMSRGVH